MRNTNAFYLWTFASLMLVVLSTSCKDQENHRTAAEEAVVETAPPAPGSGTSDAAMKNTVAERRFVRTADIRFSVKDVAASTYIIESLAIGSGGFVTHTNLHSNVIEKDQVQTSSDSASVQTRFTVENEMSIRIPNNKLDTVIKAIVAQAAFLDYRVIKADDAALQLLANEMEQKRMAKSSDRVAAAIDSKGKKFNEVIDAEQKLTDRATDDDNAKLRNLDLLDKIGFSTITLALYQPETSSFEVIAVPAAAVRPPFGLRLLDSLRDGWYVLEGIIAVVLKFWSVLLLFGIGWFTYKRYSKTRTA